MGEGPLAQHEAAVAIGAFDIMLVAHLQIDAGVAERSPTAVAGDAGVVDFNDFRGFDRHGNFPIEKAGGIIAGAGQPATGMPRDTPAASFRS